MLPWVYNSEIDHARIQNVVRTSVTGSVGSSLSATFSFLPDFDVFCDLPVFLNRCMVIWNLFINSIT